MAISIIAGTYKNHRLREISYWRLLEVGLKYLKKAYVIKNFIELKEQWSKFKALGNSEYGIDIIDIKFLEEHLIDHIKIMICFENFLKGLLIKKGYIVHKLNKSVDNKFNILVSNLKQPLRIGEYKRVEREFYDPVSKNKTLRALKSQTLALGTLLSKQQYLDIFKIPNDIITVIDDFKRERNTLHLRQFSASGISDKYVSSLEKLINFVNNRLIRDHNNLVRKYNEEQYWDRYLLDEIPL